MTSHLTLQKRFIPYLIIKIPIDVLYFITELSFITYYVISVSKLRKIYYLFFCYLPCSFFLLFYPNPQKIFSYLVLENSLSNLLIWIIFFLWFRYFLIIIFKQFWFNFINWKAKNKNINTCNLYV